MSIPVYLKIGFTVVVGIATGYALFQRQKSILEKSHVPKPKNLHLVDLLRVESELVGEDETQQDEQSSKSSADEIRSIQREDSVLDNNLKALPLEGSTTGHCSAFSSTSDAKSNEIAHVEVLPSTLPTKDVNPSLKLSTLSSCEIERELMLTEQKLKRMLLRKERLELRKNQLSISAMQDVEIYPTSGLLNEPESSISYLHSDPRAPKSLLVGTPFINSYANNDEKGDNWCNHSSDSHENELEAMCVDSLPSNSMREEFRPPDTIQVDRQTMDNIDDSLSEISDLSDFSSQSDLSFKSENFSILSGLRSGEFEAN